jgi:hypothetical protein
MSAPSTSREALMAELLGDLAKLLDRVETLAPKIDAARQALVGAATEVVSNVKPLPSRVAAITDRAEVKAVEHIVKPTNAVARVSPEAQTAAMSQAAQDVLNNEVATTLQRLTVSLEQIARGANKPWVAWATHASTAAISAAATSTLVLYVLGK